MKKCSEIFLIVVLSCLSIFAKSPTTISGKIVSVDRVPLSYANIVIRGTSLGTISDEYGHFSLTHTYDDSIWIVISYIGFETTEIGIAPSRESIDLKEIILSKEIILFSPLEIVGESRLRKQQAIEPDLKLIRFNDIPTVPSIGGSDVFRVIQTMGGVNSTSEFSNQLYIRGGTPDQNLILLNGAPLYQPFHLFGLSSSISSTSVDYIKYYSGGFSVEHGDHMSAVLDIVTKAGSKRFSGIADLGLFESSVSLAGPLFKKLRWRLNARRSYYDLYGSLFHFKLPYHYYDIEGKLSYLPDSNTLITLNAFISEDNLHEYSESTLYNSIYKNHPDPQVAFADSNTFYMKNQNQLKWANQLASLHYLKKLSAGQLLEGKLYYSSIEQNLAYHKCFLPHPLASELTLVDVDQQNEMYNYIPVPANANTNLIDIGGSFCYEHHFSTQWNGSVGAGFSHRDLDYYWEMLSYEKINPYINMFMDYPPDTMDYARSILNAYLFLETLYEPTDKLSLRFGLRPTLYSAYAAISPDPRLNLTYKIYPWLSFKSGIGWFAQSLSSSQEYGFYSVANIYLLADELPVCRHLFGGFYLDLPNATDLSLNFYHKRYNNLMIIDESANPISGLAESYGFDFAGDLDLKENIHARFLYCYSITEKEDDTERFYPNYDIRHRVVSQLTLRTKKNYSFDIIWNFSSGRPANLTNIPTYIGDTSDLPSFLLEMPKNSFRYPAFHRLDIGIEKRRKLRHGLLKYRLDIINVYWRKNVVYYKDIDIQYEYDPFDSDSPYYQRLKNFDVIQFNGFPLFPVIGVNYEF